jgi:hypothetical protein
MLPHYVVFERVARFPRRLGSGYPPNVTKVQPVAELAHLVHEAGFISNHTSVRLEGPVNRADCEGQA